MPTPRQIVADQLRTDNPSFTVRDYPHAPAQVAGSYLVVWRSDVTPAAGTELALKHSLTINAYTVRTSSATAEDEADTLLDSVMLSLQRIEGFVFETAERSVFDESFQGWKITGHLHTENYPRSTVIGE